jgi:hypothetical protein
MNFCVTLLVLYEQAEGKTRASSSKGSTHPATSTPANDHNNNSTHAPGIGPRAVHGASVGIAFDEPSKNCMYA